MSEHAPVPDPTPPGDEDLNSTASLLSSIRLGDLAARDRLVARYWNRLRRWAHGRAPSYIRDLNQTEDLVQITFLRALERLEEFDNRREGAFLAYLRTVFLNLVRDEIRKHSRRPSQAPLGPDAPDNGSSPLDDAIGREVVERYERELLCLTDEVREAVIMKVEMGYSYPEIAAAQGIDKPNTVRMRVERALAKMAERLKKT